ncbi:uncharacterized protein BYT42DRAFT_568234, partial [Radiomyces spectabilis]|uniref:uncharacterized protein n=1 Tax=Radiomyces spectabilis TaxID=64574 RepID=UPI0022206EB3
MSVKDMENQPMIAFVGGGNMAEAMLGGLYNSGYPKDHLGFSEPFNERRSYMTEKYPNVKSFSDSKQVVEGAQIIFFAVKPQIMPAVMGELKEKLKENPHALLISVAGGVTTDNIRRWLNASSNVSLIRMMPNTPMLIGEGAVGLFATDTVDAKQRELTETILRTVAKQLVWVKDESLLDTITAVSGSGPAYYFLIMEAMR